jgi:hypothetical protein
MDHPNLAKLPTICIIMCPARRRGIDRFGQRAEARACNFDPHDVQYDAEHPGARRLLGEYVAQHNRKYRRAAMPSPTQQERKRINSRLPIIDMQNIVYR